MSIWIQVFADGYGSLDDFAKDVSDRMGVRIRWEPKFGDYEFSTGKTFGVVKPNKYENDRDIIVEDLPYVVTARLDDRKFGEGDPHARRFASDLFAKLKTTGKHRLLMTFDLERILDKFDPGKND